MTKVKILSTENITHDVVKIKTGKPQDFKFRPGQAADLSLDKSGWEDETRPFTFTSLSGDDHLEFVIKIYPDHDGVTEQIGKLEKDDTLNIGDVFGAINYEGEGVFLAGGAGVTPFISILKNLGKEGKTGNNKLIFANKTSGDIIEADYFEQLLGDNFINVLSEENTENTRHGFITREMISEETLTGDCYFYLCGPPPMMDEVLEHLQSLEVSDDHIIKEDFG